MSDVHFSSTAPSNCACTSTSDSTNSPQGTFYQRQVQPTSIACTTKSTVSYAQATFSHQERKIPGLSSPSACLASRSVSVAMPIVATADQQKANGFINCTHPGATVNKSGAQVPRLYSGQSYKFDSNGKLRLGSPRQPLKRLENNRCRRKSKRHHASKRSTGQLNVGENLHIQA